MTTTCLICIQFMDESEVTKLKCGHSFCWNCLNKYLKDNISAKIKCPADGCSVFVRDAVIRKVLPDDIIEKYENLCIKDINKSHHCLLPNCPGSIIYTDEDVQYACPTCTLYNCIKCKAAHNFITCAKFQSLDKKNQNSICQGELRRASEIINSIKRNQNRNILLELENVDLITNQDVFNCSLCTMNICKGDGVHLRNCSHEFCRSCLKDYINGSRVPVVCPNNCCQSDINDREIQSILNNDDLILYQAKCNTHSKKKLKSYFQCQTPNCNSFYEYDKNPGKFVCKTCKGVNCTRCNAVHEGDCKSYGNSKVNDFTYQDVEKKIKEGKLMRCPGCQSFIEKTSGCNWVQCGICSLECCWILQIARWGPKGRGDNSGGCKCGVNGKKCDKRCTSSCTPHSLNVRTY